MKIYKASEDGDYYSLGWQVREINPSHENKLYSTEGYKIADFSEEEDAKLFALVKNNGIDYETYKFDTAYEKGEITL